MNIYYVWEPDKKLTTKIKIEAGSGQDAAKEYCRRNELSCPATVIVDSSLGLGPTREYQVEAWVQTIYHARLVG